MHTTRTCFPQVLYVASWVPPMLLIDSIFFMPCWDNYLLVPSTLCFYKPTTYVLLNVSPSSTRLHIMVSPCLRWNPCEHKRFPFHHGYNKRFLRQHQKSTEMATTQRNGILCIARRGWQFYVALWPDVVWWRCGLSLLSLILLEKEQDVATVVTKGVSARQSLVFFLG